MKYFINNAIFNDKICKKEIKYIFLLIQFLSTKFVKKNINKTMSDKVLDEWIKNCKNFLEQPGTI